MSAVAFDTLKYAKRLKEAGFTEQQAEALASAQVDLIEANLATKADILGLKRDIKELEGATKAVIKTEIAQLRAALETRFAPLESDLRWTKWIITGGVGLYALRSLIEWLR